MFTHLHLHTTYSLLDGQCQIVPLVKRARKLGMKALAVTDHGNLFALKSFYDECRSKKAKTYGDLADVHVKPILGCEAYVVDHDYREKAEYWAARQGQKERRFHLCLHARNKVGYHNLVKLLSEAHINGFYGRPRIDHGLLEKYHEGLHCSSACIAGEVAYYLDDSVKGGNNPARAESIARWYKELFGEDYSLEVMLHKSTKAGDEVPVNAREEFVDLYNRQLKIVRGMLDLGRRLDIRVIATNDVHFLDKADDDSHDVLLALSTGKKMSDTNRLVYTGEEYFKTEEEMRALFAENPELIENTNEVADRVEEYELDSPPIMPKFAIPASFGTEEEYAKKFDDEKLKAEFNVQKPNNFDRLGGYEKVLRIKFEADYLASLVWAGSKIRWGDAKTGEIPQDVRDRVQFELDTIKLMGFPGYFLIVRDYIRAAREECGVWVGPGRGSAAGSAVAYALWITNVDPLKYDLLFERFLNPDRISMPDIDVDFDDAGRERVLDYVTRRYGADHVAHIVTFGQMAAKSAIKDVGRVMDYPLAATNKLAALVPNVPKINFKKARAASPELEAAFCSEDPVVHKLMERAGRLEGCIRQPGVHACGVIISRDPIAETLPVMPTPEKGGKKTEKTGGGGEEAKQDKLLTTQYDGHFVEPVGLLKMDFLGLKTLSVEKECVAILGKDNPRVPEFLRGADGFLDPDRIPDDDKETYELFGRGETTGLFQFESDGMKKHLMALQPEKLTDLVAMNALYRPGPMAYIPDFIDRKQGRKPVVYDHPEMESRLKDTYGITVYQEQVMLLSRDLAGFTRGESDKLRKAMGKKLMDIMAELYEKFVKGCLANPKFRCGTAEVAGRKLDLTKEEDAKVLIEKIWKDWEAFASYAFNKSHSVCYAWVAYQTGYLKAHYPAEFMCAQISSEIGNFDKLPGFVAEAQAINLDLRLPDVNESGSRFVPTPDAKGIRYGLGGIKGVGELAAEAIVAERKKNGPYAGFMDFCMRLAGSNAVNKRVLENLTRTGAFSTLEPNRAKLFNNIEYALKKAQQKAKDDASAQANFFDLMCDSGKETVSDRELRDTPPFTPAEDLKNERDLLGVYVSGHPLQSCRQLIAEGSVCCVRARAPEAKEDTFEFLPFSLDKIAKKPKEAEEAAEEKPELEDEPAPSEPVAHDDDEDDDETEEAKAELSPIDELLMKCKDDEWQLKGLARNIVKAKGEIQWSDKAAFDKAVNAEKAKLKKRFERGELDRRLLKKLDVRVVAMLVGCSVKVPKPRPDGSVGQKWAIFALDDGRGQADAMCYAKAWASCEKLAERIDQLVMVCGEVSHRSVYANDDATKENPTIGEVSFSVKEAYPVEDVLPVASKALTINLSYEDVAIESKVKRLYETSLKNPGKLPMELSVNYASGQVVKLDAGPVGHVAANLSFLSELGKILPQNDTAYRFDEKIYFAALEPKPWER